MGLVVDEKPASISLPIAQDEYDSTLGLTRKVCLIPSNSLLK